MAFQPFSYGNVLAQGEQIKSARAARDPNSLDNRYKTAKLNSLNRQEESAVQDEATEEQVRNTRILLSGLEQVSNNPAVIEQVVADFKMRGITPTGFDHTVKTPEALQADAANAIPMLKSRLDALTGEKPEGYTLSPGGQRRGRNHEILAEAPHKPPTPGQYGQPVKALGPDGKPAFIRTSPDGSVEPVQNYTPPPSSPLVSMSPGESAEQKEIGKIHAKWYGSVMDNAEAARETIYQIDQMEAIDIETGALEPAKAAFAGVIEGLGFDASVIANVTNAQAFTAVSARLVNKVLNQAKGPQTEGDAQRARSTIATLGNTPEARRFINASLKATALRAVEMDDFIAARVESGDNIRKARAAWRKFKVDTPNLSSIVKTPSGLPMFFYQFKEHANNVRPGITDAEVIEAWRKKHGK